MYDNCSYIVFMISISKDGTTFTDVLKGVSTGVTRAPENYDLPSSANIDVRFIRITVFGNVDSDNNSKTSSEAAISEIKLFTEPSS